jgi:hypothetical protein|uniref:Uncharacterized protein n=1 Tax=viral metagenome TaxID=1070528 RepID=A0A6C0D012_9ZZZZ
MTSVEKTYTLNKIQQLVDLNGDTTNFDLTFTVVTHDKSPFEALVVDQKTLDSDKDIEFKKADGTISGNIVTDNGNYQNYFLILKSDKPTECTVKIDKKEIPERQESNSLPSLPHTLNDSHEISTSFFNIRNILICLAITGLLVFLYYYFNTKKDELPIKSYIQAKNEDIHINLPMQTVDPIQTIVAKPLTLMDRLNKLNIDE